jgi:hypothetical protein
MRLIGLLSTLIFVTNASPAQAFLSHHHCTAPVTVRISCPLQTVSGAWSGELTLISQCGDVAQLALTPTGQKPGPAIGFVGFFGQGKPAPLSLSRLLLNNEPQVLSLSNYSANVVLDPAHQILRVTRTNGKISVSADIIGREQFYSQSHPELKNVEISSSSDCRQEI